ncbi:MAG: molybdopterin molybdotransferase MoeA [Pirellulales bacterium]|nr:molybdopterin molybdotransferase MoeA [Pirellulales bacterium]
MLSVDEALARLAQHVVPRAAVERACGAALGLVLAETIASDVDSPPHDKALVDGYAVVASDLSSGRAELRVLEEVTAGQVPTCAVCPGAATRVMTGAPMPPGADAMVMIERTQTRLAADGTSLVDIVDAKVAPGQNIMTRGRSMRAGDVVLMPGAVLRPIELGLLAEVGRTTVRVVPAPKVAILSTGDELVEPGRVPAAGQIRNSNGPLLAAAARRAGADVLELGIARDTRDDLRTRIGAGLEAADVLVLSGGVSAGVLDLVPAVLAELGVACVFHKVNLKPGKPVWFGTQAHSRGARLVFGLPGNPVSSLVCYELFVRPALARLAGGVLAGAPVESRPLAAAFTHRGERPTYHPGRYVEGTSGSAVEPLRWQGSADLRTLAAADALIHFPSGDCSYQPGQMVSVQRL